jgi:sec-independent protein translocase protein TatA
MGIHWTELLIISVVALLVFGPKRLPEMGSAIGKTYKEFKKSLSEVAASATTEVATSAQITPAPQTVSAAQVVNDTPRT